MKNARPTEAESSVTANGAPIIPNEADTHKRLANLKAQAALIGVVVHQLADGAFLACRWNLSRDLSDLDALEIWLSQQGLRHGRA